MFRRSSALALAALVFAACEGDNPLESNHAPNATIHADATGQRGVAVTLDGTASSDPDGDALTYTWTLSSRPSGSTAAITSANQATASFVPDRTGSYTVQLTVSDGDENASATHTMTIDVQSLSGTISSDSVLPNTTSPAGEFDYHVPAGATLTIVGGLTIQPGVSIRMGANSSIHVATAGSLRAVGTAALPIAFIGQSTTPGSWYGFEIDSNNALNELTHVEVAYGGPVNYANVWVDGTLRLTNSTLRGAATYGLVASGSAQLPGFANNSFDGNGIAAVNIPAQLVGSLDAASNYAGTSNGHVDVEGGTVTGTQTWRSINTPYRFAGNSTVTLSGAVTIQPGARFIMDEGSFIHVAAGGSLAAVGTATDSIRFVGASDIAGYWYGFEIDSNNSANRMSYVVVANGGAGSYAGVWLDGTLRLDNSHIRRSGQFGLHASHGATLNAFASNRFTLNTAGPVEIPVGLMGALDSASVYGGNTVDRIAVMGGGTGTGSSQTWRRTDVPFYLAPGATATVNTGLTVRPGFRLLAGEGSFIHVAAGGSINAVGTATDSISFRGASPTPGYWYGFEIDSNAANVMSYVRVGHGGLGNYANLWVDGTLTASNSHIHDSATYGVEIGQGGTYVATNVTYSGNAMGNVHSN